jgi:MYXO-CTERM domain-containing protein
VTPTGANAASASDDGDNAITGSCAASPARTGRGAFALLAAAIGLAFARRRRR